MINAEGLSLRDIQLRRHFKSELLRCADEFNKKPARGIKRLQELGLIAEDLESDAGRVALFLRAVPALDKAMIGEYIGGPGPLFQKVRNAFVSTFDFRGLALDDALRMLLEGFRLPVEGQQIDRCVESFAAQYYRDNSHHFATADAVHTLSFAIIMLNTDMYNPAIKNKMTYENFKSMNRGINGGTLSGVMC